MNALPVSGAAVRRMNPLVRAVRDGNIVAQRNFVKIRRVPEILVFVLLSPIMFVLLFAYVFGGAIDPSGGGAAYREFLIAGIFAQTVVFGATNTGAGLADDVKKGIVDRFRSLPMAPSAVLTGRTLSDVVNNVIVLIVMSITGLIVGWRIHTGPLEALWGFVLLLIFVVIPLLVAVAEVAMLVVLAAGILVARVVLRRPWIVEAVRADGFAHRWDVVGWQASGVACTTVAQQLEAGLAPTSIVLV